MHPPFRRESFSELPSAAGGPGLRSAPTLLVVDDDARILQMLVYYFQCRRYQVTSARSLADAKFLFRRHESWTLVISDYHLPDGTGADLKDWLREQPGGTPPFLLMSGGLQGSALNTGLDFLAKPFALADLESRVQILLHGGLA